jgi:hypothetical protein
LRGSFAQFRKEPSSGLHRARRGSRQYDCGPMAVHALGLNGAGNFISEVHALGNNKR